MRTMQQDPFSAKKQKVTYLLSVLVFWIHISTFYNYTDYTFAEGAFMGFVQTVITRPAVPLFFMISAALFYRDYTPGAYARKLRRRVSSLAVPYFAWNILMMLFQLAATVFLARFFIGRVPFDFSLRGIAEGLMHWKYNNPFWFVFALMLYALLAPALYPLLKHRYYGLVLIALSWLASRLGLVLPKTLIYHPDSLTYYLIGGYLGIHCWNAVTGAFSRPVRTAAWAVTAVCWAYEFLLCYDVLPGQPGLQALSALLAAMALWITADDLLAKVPAMDFMQHSFWVYAMHLNVSAVITKLIAVAGPKSHWMAIPNFLLTTVITLAAIELTARFLRRFCPPVYRILGGSRGR